MKHQLIALLLAALVLPPIARAVKFVPLTVQQLTREAHLIVHGTVRERTVERDENGRVDTKVQLSVTETWKGAAGREFTVVQAGGTLGERSYEVEGQEPLEPGEEVVLFLVLNERKQGVVIGLSQGKFKVRTDQKSREKTVQNLFHGKDAKGALRLADLRSKVKGGQP